MKNTSKRIVGELDFDKYAVNERITNEVVLTEERETHIVERHPEVYTIILEKMKETIEDPDEVYCELNKSDTRWAIKSLGTDYIRIIIKLKIKNDVIHKRNSVITAHRITEKRIRKYQTNKKIKMVYKKTKIE